MDPKIRPEDDGNFTEDSSEEFTEEDWIEQVGGESETNGESDDNEDTAPSEPPAEEFVPFNPEHEHGDKSDFPNG